MIERLEERRLLSAAMVRDINDAPSVGFREIHGRLRFAPYSEEAGFEWWVTDGTAEGTALLKDIKPGASSSLFASIGGTDYFWADDGVHGRELWRTDGTPEGTVLVKDITAGSENSYCEYPDDVAVVDGILYFPVEDGIHGAELWRTDGTEGGTFLVKDCNPGSSGSQPTFLTNFNNRLYFEAYLPAIGRYVLWASDGTEAGTAPLYDVATAKYIQNPQLLTVFNGALFYSEPTGWELWKTDGTVAGAAIVKDINPGVALGNVRNLTVAGGTLYFTATDGASGVELWRSDGTEAGTVRVKDIATGAADSSPGNLMDINGTLYFTATTAANGTELWKSDGTEAGTVLVEDVDGGASNSQITDLTAVGDTLYFRAFDPTGVKRLWKTDAMGAVPTAVGTSIISSPTGLVRYNGMLHFAARDNAGRIGFWKTDGSDAGTQWIMGLDTRTSVSNPSRLTAVNGILYYVADDGVHGAELWRTDGTSQNTYMVRDIQPGPTGSGLANLFNHNGVLYFTTNESGGSELWKSDGTAEGTVPVKDLRAGGTASINSLTSVGEILYFAADDGASGLELWKSDGTAAGTAMVKDIRVGLSGSSIANLIHFNGALYFAANDGTNGTELWMSDGTETGTLMVKDVRSGIQGSSPSYLTIFGGALYFAATATSGTQLWKSDGTAAGTAMVTAIGTSAGPQHLTAAGDSLYFSASTAAAGRELWKTDGTAAGTVLVKDIVAGTGNSQPYKLTNVGGTLFFAVLKAASDELWKSDGTADGTVMLKDVTPPLGHISPDYLAELNGRLFFKASGGLWMSDGTPEGTVMAGTARRAPERPSNVSYLAAVNGSLYLQAYSERWQSELWRVVLPVAQDDAYSLDSGATAALSVGADAGVLKNDHDPMGGGVRAALVSGPQHGSVSLAADGSFTYTPAPGYAGPDGFTYNVVDGDGLFVPGRVSFNVYQVQAEFALQESGGAEGGGARMIEVRLSGVSTQDITIPIAISGTATADSDYSIGTLVIPAGATSGSFTITPVNDGAFEGDETVVLTLQAPANAVLGTGVTHTFTITNDDAAPTITVDDASVQEGDAGTSLVAFTVRLSNPSDQAITVHYATADGTGRAEDGDYVAVEGVLTFDPGITSRTISVLVAGDGKYEAGETFYVNLSDAANGALGDERGEGTIVNDDAPPTVQFAAAGQVGSEGGGAMVVTVQLSAAAGVAIPVSFAIGGTATRDADYVIAPAGLVIPAGETTGTVTVTPLRDRAYDRTETVILTLEESATVVAGATKVHTIPIRPADLAAPTAQLGSPLVAKAGGRVLRFSVVYSDDMLLRARSIDGKEITVTGPKRFSQVARLVGKTPAKDAHRIVATYEIVPPGGKWDAADNGGYSVWLNARQVMDAKGKAAAAGKVGTFRVGVGRSSAVAATAGPVFSSTRIVGRSGWRLAEWMGGGWGGGLGAERA